MARKGNPISVRLDLNRSSDSSRFLSKKVLRSLLRVFCSLLGTIVAGFLVRYVVPKQGLAVLLLIFLCLALLIRQFTKKRRFCLLLVIPFFVVICGFLVRSLLFGPLVETAIGAGFVLYMMNGEGGNHLPVGHAELPFHRSPGMEASIQMKIADLEAANSPFLPQDSEGGFWENINGHLESAPNQQEYNRRLNFEDLDVEVRRQKQATLTLFRQLVTQFPQETVSDMDGTLTDFFNAPAGAHGYFIRTNQQELDFVQHVHRDLATHGGESACFREIIASHAH
jgi:hypothetical protein